MKSLLFMKFPAVLLLAFSMVCACVHAAETVYELKHTVTYKDGTKSEGNVMFTTIGGALVPIDLGMAGLCVLEFSTADVPETAPPTHGTFQVRTTLGSTGPEMKKLFYSKHTP